LFTGLNTYAGTVYCMGGGISLDINNQTISSSVLNSRRALQVNISIMRTFTKLRSFLLMENDNSSRVNKLEEGTNRLFKVVFQRLDEIEEIITPNLKQNRKKIGIKRD
jgi:hypothetical protein